MVSCGPRFLLTAVEIAVEVRSVLFTGLRLTTQGRICSPGPVRCQRVVGPDATVPHSCRGRPAFPSAAVAAQLAPWDRLCGGDDPTGLYF